jgi:hypothetical protein
MQLQYESVQARSAEIKAALDHLAGSKVAGDSARDTYLETVFPASEEDSIEAQAKTQDTRTSVGMLYEGQATGYTEAFKGSYYGLYNSVVEHLDYNQKRSRAAARWVGPNGTIKEHAFATAMDMAGV